MPDEYTLVLSEFITSGQCFIDCKAICKLYAGLSKVAGCLVSICWLLCLAFLYRWRFLNKISLDWPLTLTTQPSTSKLSDNPVYVHDLFLCCANRSASLQHVNNMLREQLEQATSANQQLTLDIQKLTADWNKAREELDARDEEEQAYFANEHVRLMDMWKAMNNFRRQFNEMKSATQRCAFVRISINNSFECHHHNNYHNINDVISSLVLPPWPSHLITIYLVCLNSNLTPESAS